MSAQMSDPIDDLASAGARDVLTIAWGVLLVAGLLTIGFGVILIVWTHATLAVLAWLLAATLIITAISQLWRGFTGTMPGAQRAMLLVSGSIAALLAFLAVRGYAESHGFHGSTASAVVVLAAFVGATWLLRGISELATAASDKDAPLRGWYLFSGILSILGAIIIFVAPFSSLIVLARITGVILIIRGLVEVMFAFKVRSIRSTIPAPGTRTIDV